MSDKTIVFTKLTEVKKIVHIADIHIRLYKRHQEYQAVFEKLYESLRNRDLTDTIIVIAGDIVHAKTDMSPEMVRIASEFLRNLCKLAPTIIIAGNHDLNLANPNRLDALSPIVDNIRTTQLYYFRESGIYKFANVQFGVHSIIGLPEEWPSPQDMESGPKIALYHGPVNKAQTDAGYTITNRVTVETFSGYDMVLLGDIHRTQLLQEKGQIGVPEIMYPGSLIQQNHGESTQGHGYIVWDVASCTAEKYVEIENDYGYFTLTLKDTTMPDLKGMPKNVRLRILVGDVDNSLVKKIQAMIRKKCTVVECSINKLVEKKTSTGNSTNSVVDDIHDVTHQNTLIRSYIENHFPGTGEDVITRVQEINTELNNLIGDEELPKNINWRPIYLKFDNLFSYGEDNEINFNEMKGLYGVFSANATGKTSAFDALCFALYDKTPRAFKGSHILNTRKDSCFCELHFEVSGRRYIIQRTGTRKKNGEVKVDVNFYRVEEDNTQISLNGEDRRDTNAAIRSYVGTYEDFILTTLSVQNQNSLFIDTGQSDRKDLLSQFIGLTIFDRLFNLAADQVKEISGALKSFKRDDFTQKLADVQTQIESEQLLYNSLQTDLLVSQERGEFYQRQVGILYEKKVPNVEDIDPKPIEEQLEVGNLIIEEIQTKINRIKVDMDFKDNEMKNVIPSHLPDEHVLRQEYDEFLRAKDALLKLQSQLRVLQTDAKNKKDKLAKLKEHEYDPNCKYCVNNVFVKDAVATQSEYDLLLPKIDKLEMSIYEGEKYLTSREHAESNFKYGESVRKQYRNLENEKNKLAVDLVRLESSFRAEELKTIHLHERLKTYQLNEQLIKQNNEIQIEINRILELQKINLMEINKIQKNIQTRHAQVEVLKRQKEDMLRTIKEAEELETTYEAYETYLLVIGRDGLPYELISQVIPTLQSEVNNILTQMVEFTVAMDVDGKNINGKIIYDDEKTWPLELASGMEKFVSSLAIRVALMSVSNLPKSNFLVIDEGLGVLDSENLSSMFQLFNLLKTQFEFIVLISHLDIVRDIADNLIEIKREDGYSHIKVE